MTDPPTASGGELLAEIGWNIDAWELAPMAFRLTKRQVAQT